MGVLCPLDIHKDPVSITSLQAPLVRLHEGSEDHTAFIAGQVGHVHGLLHRLQLPIRLWSQVQKTYAILAPAHSNHFGACGGLSGVRSWQHSGAYQAGHEDEVVAELSGRNREIVRLRH
ncbi:hypothetical protein E2C01_009051 [Portunus trituberculatus]|uniref:Uncharacterized protein n=1 Tax=Portunus trituberculatus TaxID=210409 RepID=A0A5B7D4F1_PORTR|nr:hypothetical protein [Portunus trituberculatus]